MSFPFLEFWGPGQLQKTNEMLKGIGFEDINVGLLDLVHQTKDPKKGNIRTDMSGPYTFSMAPEKNEASTITD